MEQKESLRKFKLFFAWDDNKEEAWLEEMSRKGWHLASVGIPTLYNFVSGEAKPYTYRLDFITATNKEDRQDYYQLFSDAGWDHIGEMGGWQYFRKLAKGGEAAEIFTDNQSKIQKYQRLIGFLALIAVSIIPMTIVLANSDFSVFYRTILVIYLAMGLIYGYSIFKIWKRIQDLKNT